MPRVSVIMPCFNHERYVGDAIASVLAQTMPDFELIVVEDCSTDGSRAVIEDLARKDPRVRPVYHSKNAGEGRSRNDGMAASTGEYLAFLDADDLMEPERLEAQCAHLDGTPSCDVVHTDSVIVDEAGRPTGQSFSERFHRGLRLTGNLHEEVCVANFINMPSVMMRRRCLDVAGGFEEGYRYLADWMFWAKMSPSVEFGFLPAKLTRYRVHSGSTSWNWKGYVECRLRGYRTILERFPDLSPRTRSKIQYEMAIQYRAIGEGEEAKAWLGRSIRSRPLTLKGCLRYLQWSVVPARRPAG